MEQGTAVIHKHAQVNISQHWDPPRNHRPDPKQMETVGPRPRHHHSHIYFSQYDLHQPPSQRCILSKCLRTQIQSFLLAFFTRVSAGALVRTCSGFVGDADPTELSDLETYCIWRSRLTESSEAFSVETTVWLLPVWKPLRAPETNCVEMLWNGFSVALIVWASSHLCHSLTCATLDVLPPGAKNNPKPKKPKYV